MFLARKLLGSVASRDFYFISSSPIFGELRADRVTSPEQAAIGVKGRKKQRKRSQVRKALFRSQMPEAAVVAIPLARELQLGSLFEYLRTKGKDVHPRFVNDEANDALHVANYSGSSTFSELFLFNEGVAVFWNMNEAERIEALRWISKHQTDPYPEKVVQDETEFFRLTRHSSQESDANFTRVHRDVVHLSSLHSGGGEWDTQAILERFAFSHGLLISSKLGVWEAILEEKMSLLEGLTKDMRQGKIRMNKKQVLQTLGEFYQFRHELNREMDLLRDDAVLWEWEDLWRLREQIEKALDLDERRARTNDNVDFCLGLLQVLDSYLANRHEVRLERIIITLIALEAAIAFIPLLLK